MTTALEDSRAGDLSAEQLLHLAACKRAADNAPPPMEYEKRYQLLPLVSFHTGGWRQWLAWIWRL
jgi:hypothetical protein